MSNLICGDLLRKRSNQLSSLVRRSLPIVRGQFPACKTFVDGRRYGARCRLHYCFTTTPFLNIETSMKTTLSPTILTAAIALAVLTSATLIGNENNVRPKSPAPHCEVPCGIYADQMRFEQMLEDTATIAKAITSIEELTGGLADTPPSAKALNQMSRWVTTKENHATNTQHIVAQYFLTQRIKEGNKDYTNQLITAHKVMVAAMKCKQDADPATATALKKAIHDLYRAYEGKEPNFDHSDK